MNKISDKDLAAGLRQRKKPEAIAAEVRETIVSQMQADAMRLPVDKISESPYQVRHKSESVLENLMESIKSTNGVVTPITVRPNGDGYEIIAGHTRYSACKKLGYTDIPAVIRHMSDAEAARALAADNLTREDLTDYEISKLLNILFSEGQVKTNSDAARLLGRSRQDVIRYQSYGKLPIEIILMLDQKPHMIGAATAKNLLEYLPDHTGIAITAASRLDSGKIKTQTGMITWIRQQLHKKSEHFERHVLDMNGVSVGKLSRMGNGLRLTSKTLDLEKIEAAIKAVLDEQGYRM